MFVDVYNAPMGRPPLHSARASRLHHQHPAITIALLLLLLLYWGKGHANPVAAHSQRANLGSCDFVPFRSPVSQVRCIGERNSPTSQPSIPVAFYFMGVPSTHQGKPWTL